MKFLEIPRFSRQDVRDNPKSLYIFGDNEERWGLGGQAKEVRGEDNSFGIPTKRRPAMDELSFWWPEDSPRQIEIIDNCLNNLYTILKSGKYNQVVLPAAGLGTGLSKLKENNPAVFYYIGMRILTLITWVSSSYDAYKDIRNFYFTYVEFKDNNNA